jgi:endonuclease/exonuclease/phosphatase family metal-dependent hydrolase
MRLATFNLESLDLEPKAQVAFETRAAVLRPALKRVAADILCLQEVNGQHVAGCRERQLVALDRLLDGTPYQHYARRRDEAGTGPQTCITLSRCRGLRSSSSAKCTMSLFHHRFTRGLLQNPLAASKAQYALTARCC